MVNRISKEKCPKRLIVFANSKPEVALRKALWTKSLRFRIYYGEEKIDIAFPSKKLAIFVDECCWHSCPIHPPFPIYYLPELKKNIENDKVTNERLANDGWKVMRFWQHDIEADISKVVRSIEEQLVHSGSSQKT